MSLKIILSEKLLDQKLKGIFPKGDEAVKISETSYLLRTDLSAKEIKSLLRTQKIEKFIIFSFGSSDWQIHPESELLSNWIQEGLNGEQTVFSRPL